MDLWYSEKHSEYVKLSIKVDKHLYSTKTEFQRIDVFDCFDLGRVLVMDGIIMLTEKDEFIYHEMITHVPLAVHKNPENVLVIGAGDGGVLRELSKHSCLKKIDIVEIDKEIVKIAKKYLPFVSCGFLDKRVHIFYEDGLKFVRKKHDEYDIIIVDSTDPFGPGEDLFTREFYGNCFKALHEDGILVNQHESAFYEADAQAMRSAHKHLFDIFPIAKVYGAHIPTYSSGHWLFGFSSKKYHPIRDQHELDIETQYYNFNLHRGSFYLPNYINEKLKSCENFAKK